MRLTPAGFGLRTGHGLCLLTPWSDRTYLYIRHMEGNTYRIRISPASKENLIACDWAKMDFDCDAETARRILECAAQWRCAMPPAQPGP